MISGAVKLDASTIVMTIRVSNPRLMSKTLRGEWVGLEEIDDGIWSLYYGPVLLARFDEREMRFYG